MLDMGVYNRENRSLQRIKYANAINPASRIGLDMVKGSLAIFIAEVLFRSIREQEPNQNLFSFLVQFISDLETEDGSVSNYHLLFMLDLTGYLGFYPSSPSSGSAAYFDKREGLFCVEVPQHGDWMDEESSEIFKRLMRASTENIASIKLSSLQRNDLLNHLIAFYDLHLDARLNIKSHKILQTVM